MDPEVPRNFQERYTLSTEFLQPWVLAMCLSLFAFPQTNLAGAEGGVALPDKVGIIHIQDAILRTTEGEKAVAELQAKFTPKKQELDRKQGEIAQLQEQLRKGENTLNDEAKQKLMVEIDQKTKAVNRETEDAQADLDEERGKILQGIGSKVMAVVTKYAKDHGYGMIVDVSSQQTPVLYASPEIDITPDIIALYDKASIPQTTSSTTSLKPSVASAAPTAAGTAK